MATSGNVRMALAVCLALAGCGRLERPAPDTTAVALEEPTDPLASRQECQDALDAARTALVRKRVDACITSLTDAAAFFRDQSRTDAPEVRPALQAAAEELETLAANVARGRAPTPRDFDRAFARAHAAEASQHLAHARAALLESDDKRAGAEFLMAVDHLERAAKDAKLRDDSRVERAVADTRSLAGEMVRGTVAVPDESNKVSAEIERALKRVVDYVYVAPGPEPLTRYD